MPAVLSIQSRVVYGCVGNTAAVPALHRLGHDAFALDTVVFSNHPGHGRWRGEIVAAAALAALFEGLVDLDVPRRCDAVLSGYLGDAATGGVLLDIVARVKRANPSAVFCCDPVIGDDGAGIYVRAGLSELFRDRLLPLADIATPNRFELAWLTGRDVASIDEARAAAEALRDRGPQTVLVTSLEPDPASIAILVVDAAGAWLAETPKLPIVAQGCGDLAAALFLGRRLNGESSAAALGGATASVYDIIEATLRSGRNELALVAALDHLAAPTYPVRLRRL